MLTEHDKKMIRIIYGDDFDFDEDWRLDGARTTLQYLAKLPFGFHAVTDARPSNDRPVLAIRRASYCSCDFEVLTAKYAPDYRPRSPWQTVGNDSVLDDGEPILGWRPADDWFYLTD